MPKECANCGDECIKTKGKYRKLCPSCNAEKATQTRHVEQCELDECIVCGDRLQEYREVIRPLYLQVQLEKTFTTKNMNVTGYND